MINRTVPPLSIVPPGVTSWGTFSFVIALLVELQAVGDLINLALVPATLSFVSHPGLLNSFAMDGFLLVRLVDTPSKRLRVVSLQLVHRRAVQNDHVAGHAGDARSMHRGERWYGPSTARTDHSTRARESGTGAGERG